VIALLRIALRLLADLVGFIALALRPQQAEVAENLVLRRQLARYKERGIKPRRIYAAIRISLPWLCQTCRSAKNMLPATDINNQPRSRPGRLEADVSASPVQEQDGDIPIVGSRTAFETALLYRRTAALQRAIRVSDECI
jgi:hypothetical protein